MTEKVDKKDENSEVVAAGFRRGEPREVEKVRCRVSRIVAFRGYSIPMSERKDLEQEIMAQLWNATRRPQFDESAGFWGFVELVALRRCIDWRRGRKNFTSFDPETPDSRKNPLQAVLTRERRQLVARALLELGDPCRKLMELHFHGRKTYRELAKIFGKGEGALRMQMLRCIRGVRQILARMDTDFSLRSPEITG